MTFLHDHKDKDEVYHCRRYSTLGCSLGTSAAKFDYGSEILCVCYDVTLLHHKRCFC